MYFLCSATTIYIYWYYNMSKIKIKFKKCYSLTSQFRKDHDVRQIWGQI